MTGEFKCEVAIVTASGRGIGEAVVRKLTAQGVRVSINDPPARRRAPHRREAAKRVLAEGREVRGPGLRPRQVLAASGGSLWA